MLKLYLKYKDTIGALSLANNFDINKISRKVRIFLE